MNEVKRVYSYKTSDGNLFAEERLANGHQECLDTHQKTLEIIEDARKMLGIDSREKGFEEKEVEAVGKLGDIFNMDYVGLNDIIRHIIDIHKDAPEVLQLLTLIDNTLKSPIRIKV